MLSSVRIKLYICSVTFLFMILFYTFGLLILISSKKKKKKKIVFKNYFHLIKILRNEKLWKHYQINVRALNYWTLNAFKSGELKFLHLKLPWKIFGLYSQIKHLFLSSVSYYTFSRQISLSPSPNLKTLFQWRIEGSIAANGQRAIREGQRVHAHMIRIGKLYDNCDCLSDARKVFDEMPQRNWVSGTVMISAYSLFCLRSLESVCGNVKIR